MKITLYNNTFFEIECGSETIVCDPFVGKMRDTATWSYPILYDGPRILEELQPNYIYISHLHYDHFDKELLDSFNDKHIPILIKYFSNRRLFEQISRLGFTNVRELQPWKRYSLGSSDVSIIPQTSTNGMGIETSINYELDTSIVIHETATDVVFLNNVDNPHALDGFKAIKKFVDKEYGTNINAAAISPTAGAEFPQCFYSIDRNSAKNDVIEQSNTRIRNALNILKPEYYIHCGAKYVFHGKFSPLQQFVAIAETNQINKSLAPLRDSFLKDMFCIDGGGTIELLPNGAHIIREQPDYPSFKDCQNLLKNETYDYLINQDGASSDLKSCADAAIRNYYDAVNKLQPKYHWEIVINLYREIGMESNAVPVLTEPELTFSLTKDGGPTSIPQQYLMSVHLETTLFQHLVTGKSNWNMCIAGSLMFFERSPNEFIPDLPFSLNYLRL